jgi:hypothetical protein
MRRSLLTSALLLVGTLWSSTSEAHLVLLNPPPRYGRNQQKDGPCGRVNGERSANVTTFRAGEQILVVWDEFINHPGHFRISFDSDGHDDFVDPPCLANCNTRNPTIELNSNSTVLLDGIPDTPQGGRGMAVITLPNITCTNCTLQVIQVMYNNPPYTVGPGNDDLYYQCADIILEADPNEVPIDVDAGAGDLETSDAGDVADAGSPIDAGGVVETEDRGTPDAGVAVIEADIDPMLPENSMAEATQGASANGYGNLTAGCTCTPLPPRAASLALWFFGALSFVLLRRRTRPSSL